MRTNYMRRMRVAVTLCGQNKKEEGMSKDGRDRGSSSHVGRKGDDLTGASIFSAQTDVSLILFDGFAGFFARIDWRGL